MAKEKSPKKFVVQFTGISDKQGNLRFQGETVTADELTDADFQLQIGAIAEAEQKKVEETTEK